MSFLIREARLPDLSDLNHLATTLASQGFLTLPHDQEDLKRLILISQNSFGQKLKHRDEGKYLFVLEDRGKVIGSSLIIARHGTPESPHIYFQVNPEKGTLKLEWETTGRTELGGLILNPAYRGHTAKLGKKLSYIRLLYILHHPDQFLVDIIAELLPPFDQEGHSPFWEALGRKFTGLDYQQADQQARLDKSFIQELFPCSEIPIDSLPREAQEVLGVAGPETKPVVKILTDVGFKYLNQIDPLDGGPHYGARQEEIRRHEVEKLFLEKTTVIMEFK